MLLDVSLDQPDGAWQSLDDKVVKILGVAKLSDFDLPVYDYAGSEMVGPSQSFVDSAHMTWISVQSKLNS